MNPYPYAYRTKDGKTIVRAERDSRVCMEMPGYVTVTGRLDCEWLGNSLIVRMNAIFVHSPVVIEWIEAAEAAQER